MEVERIERPTGHVFYRIHSEYASDSLAIEPGELMALQRWLVAHEDEITTDSVENRMREEMEGM
jgi:hypothetical protein